MNKQWQPQDFGIDDIRAAHGRIRDFIYRTPLEESVYLGTDDRRYFFKLESCQTVKSFKLRGALSVMTDLTDEERARGVGTISSGNHGSSVAYVAKLLGIENAVIIVPETAPQSKVDKIKFYGGKVMQIGSNYDEASALGRQYLDENGLYYIDGYYEDHRVYGGQGTIGIEILEQNPDIDTIVVPIGGGGLITGIGFGAKSIKADIRIIGVQTEACPAMIKSYEDKVCYEEYPVKGDTICDALVGGVGKLSYERLKEVLTDIIEVKEETIRKATRHMIREEKFIVEGGSAITVGAVMDQPDRVGGKNIALVMGGGNIDGDLMAELIK